MTYNKQTIKRLLLSTAVLSGLTFTVSTQASADTTADNASDTVSSVSESSVSSQSQSATLKTTATAGTTTQTSTSSASDSVTTDADTNTDSEGSATATVNSTTSTTATDGTTDSEADPAPAKAEKVTALTDATNDQVKAAKSAAKTNYVETNAPQKVTATLATSDDTTPASYPAGTTLTAADVENTDGFVLAGTTIGDAMISRDYMLDGFIARTVYYRILDGDKVPVLNPDPIPGMQSKESDYQQWYFGGTQKVEVVRTLSIGSNGYPTFSDWTTKDGTAWQDYEFPDMVMPSVDGYAEVGIYYKDGHNIWPAAPLSEYGTSMTNHLNNTVSTDGNRMVAIQIQGASYLPLPQKLTITFIDDSTGEQLEQLKSTLDGGTTLTPDWWTPDDEISKYVAQGYTLISNEYPTGTFKMDMDSSTDQNFNIHLAPQTTYGEVTQSRTINFESSDPTVKLPESVVQKVTYKTVTNKITGETVYTPQSAYYQYDVPVIKGYTASQLVVDQEALAPTSEAPTDSTVTVSYTPTIDHGSVDITRTVNFVDASTGAELKKPVVQTVTYKIATNEATGETVYTPQNGYDEVIAPAIDNYTANQQSVAKLTVAPTTTLPENQTVTVSYTPQLVYGQATATRTIKFTSDDKDAQLPKTVTQVVIYKTVTNKATGEVVYTPQGYYDAYKVPELAGYTVDKSQVGQVTLTPTTSAPQDSLVTVVYKKTATTKPTEPTTTPTDPATTTPETPQVNEPEPATTPDSNPAGQGEENSQVTATSAPVTPATSEGETKAAKSTVSTMTTVSNMTVTPQKKSAAAATTLPQTSEPHNSIWAIVGMTLLTMISGLFGFKTKRQH